MYENNRKLNRHERKQVHREKTKRRFTPTCYASYEDYIKAQNDIGLYDIPYYKKRIDSGWVPPHERWWKGHLPYIRKKFLKEDAHTKERAYYRDQLAHYDIEEDNIDTKTRFSDPWCWD